MLIFQPTGNSLSGALSKALSNIQELAEQVMCYSEDIEYADGRSNLITLPKLSQQLDLLHKHKDMVRVLLPSR